MINKGFIIVLLSVLGLFFSCKREKVSWDTNWTAPIAYGTLDLTNMIQDSIFGVNSDSSLQLIYKTNIININFDSLFKIPDTLISQKIALALDLSVPPGTSFINQIDERKFNIENAEIKELQIKSGKAHVTLSNPIGTGIYLTITLPGVEKNGTTLSISSFVNPGTLANPSSISFDVDFSGYMMDLRGVDGNSWNTLQSIFEVKSDPNGGTVNVTTLDSIKIAVDFQNLIPNYGRGYFGTRILAEIDSVKLDFMKNFVSGTFLLDQTYIDLKIINGIVVTAAGKINALTSYKSNTNSSVSLNHAVIGQNININPASGTWNSLVPYVYPINITNSNSNINSFIENLPDILVMDYQFEINPLGNVSGGNDFFYPLSEMKVELDLNMPTKFNVNNLKFIDTLDLSFNQNEEGIQIDHGELKLKANNLFPFSLDVDLVFLDANGFPIDTLFSNNFVQAGIPDFFGKVQSPTYSEVSYLVDNNFIHVIENAEKVVIMAELDGQNFPSTLNIYNDYTIDLKITTNIGLLIKL